MRKYGHSKNIKHGQKDAKDSPAAIITNKQKWRSICSASLTVIGLALEALVITGNTPTGMLYVTAAVAWLEAVVGAKATIFLGANATKMFGNWEVSASGSNNKSASHTKEQQDYVRSKSMSSKQIKSASILATQHMDEKKSFENFRMDAEIKTADPA
jgi:cell division GTPase FtsZ